MISIIFSHFNYLIEERQVILRIIEKCSQKENSEQLLSEILKRTLAADQPVKYEEVDLDKEIESSEEEETGSL